VTLPPGQRAIDGFPRFGTHLHLPPPPVPDDPAIEVTGAPLAEPVRVPVADLGDLPRREQSSDFHCVAGWSATGLRWEGVAFETFYRTVVEPALASDARVTHLVFGGLDGYRSVVALEDALEADALIADRLDGRPLDSDHGAPVRFVSPGQYGYMNTKHLCLIEVHTSEPREDYRRLARLVQAFLRGPGAPHPRARVWKEERHRLVPGRIVRPVYRQFIPAIRALSERGSRPPRRPE
jgi:DMSO/TMAO reductase YedYZ molybdopterin-dependent catalytic subunit